MEIGLDRSCFLISGCQGTGTGSRQQSSNPGVKNSTDIGITIDAMDLLYSNRFNGFGIAASDSDYAQLALRLREDKKIVLGFGDLHAPSALRNACTKFFDARALGSSTEYSKHYSGESNTTRAPHEEASKIILSATDKIGKKDKWIKLGELEKTIQLLYPSFSYYSRISWTRLSLQISRWVMCKNSGTWDQNNCGVTEIRRSKKSSTNLVCLDYRKLKTTAEVRLCKLSSLGQENTKSCASSAKDLNLDDAGRLIVFATDYLSSGELWIELSQVAAKVIVPTQNLLRRLMEQESLVSLWKWSSTNLIWTGTTLTVNRELNLDSKTILACVEKLGKNLKFVPMLISAFWWRKGKQKLRIVVVSKWKHTMSRCFQLKGLLALRAP